MVGNAEEMPPLTLFDQPDCDRWQYPKMPFDYTRVFK